MHLLVKQSYRTLTYFSCVLNSFSNRSILSSNGAPGIPARFTSNTGELIEPVRHVVERAHCAVRTRMGVVVRISLCSGYEAPSARPATSAMKLAIARLARLADLAE